MSGGCIRELGDIPRSATRPVGSVTSSRDSAVIRIRNLGQSIAGSGRVPLPTTASFRTG